MELDYSVVEEFIDGCNIDKSLRSTLEHYLDISWSLYGNIHVLGTEVKKELVKLLNPKEVSLIESVLKSKGIKKTTVHTSDEDITECLKEIVGSISMDDIEIEKDVMNKGLSMIEKKKSIKSLLEPLQLDDGVKELAEECFSSINVKLRTGSKINLILFYCINKAYDRMGTPRDPRIIADLVGLSYKSISRAFNFCEPKDSRASLVTCTSPIEFIPDYCKKLGIEEQGIERIKEFSKIIIEYGKELYDEFPQTIAAGLIYVYLVQSGEQITKRELSTLLGKSDATIARAQQKIMISYQKALEDPIDCMFLM